MPIDPEDYEHLLYGVSSKRTRRARTIRWVTALIAVTIVDLGLLAIDLTARNTSAENANRSEARSRAVSRVSALRVDDTSSGQRNTRAIVSRACRKVM